MRPREETREPRTNLRQTEVSHRLTSLGLAAVTWGTNSNTCGRQYLKKREDVGREEIRKWLTGWVEIPGK